MKRIGPAKQNTYKTPLALLLLLLGLLVGIPIAGVFYYQHQRSEYRTEVETDLKSITELKISEIVQWKKQRLGDAMVLFKNISFSEHVQEYLQHPNDAFVRIKLMNWMTLIQQSYDYDRVSIFDRNNVERIASLDNSDNASSLSLQRSNEAMNTGQVLFQDFYLRPRDERVFIKIFIPIYAPSDLQRVIAVAALRIDPRKYLYPMIEQWPTNSRTAETLLIRKDEDSVVYLSNVRFQENSALRSKISLQRDSIAAVMAVKGERGMVEAIDYRGKPVVAYLASVPNTPWLMVARIDREEVEEPLRERMWATFAIVVLILFGSISTIGMVIRHQRSLFYEQLYQSEKKILAGETKFRQVFDNSPVGKSLTTPDGTLVVNAAFCTMLGYTMEELQHKQWKEISHPDDIEETEKRLALIFARQTDTMSLEKRYLHKSGATVWAQVNTVLQRDETGNPLYFITTIIDISERKMMEQELIRSNKELEQFAYIASHDLQEPLRMVSSYTQMLSRRYKDKLDADALEFIAYAVDGANRMQRLINDLLDYSRVTSRKKEFETIDATVLLGYAIVNLQQKIEEQSAIITNGILPEITADPSQITRLFQNLIDNAMKYRTKDGNPVINISSVDHPDCVEFLFRDNGIGIDPKYHDRIFVIFQRLHAKEEYQGSGIGLAVCKKIAERHGGRIWFDSVLGEGTTFHVTIAKQQSRLSTIYHQ